MFLATVTPAERQMITDAQDKIRTERSLGHGPQETIELPLKWCEEAIAIHRKGLVSSKNLQRILDWVLRNPEQVTSIESVLSEQGALHMHSRGDPQGELGKLFIHHAQWRQTYTEDPDRAIQEATRAVMMAGRGLCNPVDVKRAVSEFFVQITPEASPSPE